MKTEREIVLREREAFVAGVCRWPDATKDTPIRRIREDAEKMYPLPKTTRPRVVRGVMQSHRSFEYRVVDGVLYYREYPMERWEFLGTRAEWHEHSARIMSLFASPTETVEDDGSASSQGEE